MKRKFSSLRWILLAAGIIAVVGITAMNVYSLYTLRDSAIESERQSKQIQVAEFADRIRYRFFRPFYDLASLEMAHLQESFQQNNQFPENANEILFEASKDSIFRNIYYTPASSNTCANGGSLFVFDPKNKAFEPTSDYPGVVCDGLGIARTRMRSLIQDYRYNNKVLFDTHRSMVIALVNQDTHTVIGYLAMPINRDFMVENYLAPKLAETFGPESNAGLNVWLRDWTNRQIIASSNPKVDFEHAKIEFRQQFPDFFDDWRLYASTNNASIGGASGPSLWANLVILGAAFFFLVGAMLFMFFTAQRERALAERQSDFLANVTHELKTPISVMQAAGENLADGRVDNRERLKSYGSHIYSEAVRLRKMIDRLLDVAKADAGESFIHPKPLKINKRIEKFVEEHRSYIEQKGFTLDISIPEHMPKVMLDEHSMETILSNLINNAIKYSDGEKFLGIYLSQRGKDVVLKIEDRGIGMHKESIKHIFEKFYRAEDTLTAETKGYGLGLSIVKNLVELNGGTISVNSQKGKGSTFTVTFPIINDQTEQEADTSSAEPTTASTKLASSTN